jgi:long-chain acyl-CoA synthetase
MNIVSLLRNAARVFGDRPAVSIGDELTHSYAQLYSRSVRLAAGLRGRLNLNIGDRVALVMSNRPVYLEVLFAIWHAGLAAVPVNSKLHAREVAFILDNCQASACFVTEDHAEGVAGAVADVRCVRHVISVDGADYEALMAEPREEAVRTRDDLAWLFYTSGTTGKPKGAMLSHLNLQLMAWSYLCDFDLLTEKDSILHLGPQSHAAGLLALAHVAKASHHLLPGSGGFDPGEIADVINRAESVTFFAAPTMLRRLVESSQVRGCHIDHVRSILGGAAPFYAEDVRRGLAVFGPRFTNGYGQGECPCTITAMPKHLYSAALDDQALASVGIARTGVVVRVVDPQDRELPPGEIGEIMVCSDIVMSGYWLNPQATDQALAGGWLHTGDLGALTDRGFLTLMDRSKDLIISGGSNIYPREVEDVLLTHPAVAEASVIGELDAEWGENVVAVIVARSGEAPTPEQLDRVCLENLARFKRPKRYVFVRALPRNNTGKVLKRELRNLIAGKVDEGT